ncbi:phosphopantetheine-binding protein [Piscinibacter sakaiensis]|uniref:phosphopantetheine-binding protein n=1 Tax=Piscinibacter sakaiensis TaxID=1547922 RepID=UPI00372D2639
MSDVSPASPAASPDPAALERELAVLFVEALNLEQAPEDLDVGAPLFGDGLGLDSIDILEVALEISQRYGFQLRSRGTLSFSAPDRFARHTTEPRPESMEVDGNTLRLRRGDRTRQMSLDAIPELAGLVDALRGTLSGDARTLQRQFDTRVSGQPQRWTLLLTPRDARLAAQIRSLEIVGQGPALRSVEMQMSGGDRSLMLIDAPTP